MPKKGVEPLHLAVLDPKSSASANSATWALSDNDVNKLSGNLQHFYKPTHWHEVCLLSNIITLSVITPFHFACYCEARLRAQFGVLDKPLGSFMRIMRRASLSEHRAALQFGAYPANGEDFSTHATLTIQLVPQKDEKTALSCQLECPSEKLRKNFRVLINAVEETETQILLILQFLQKAFLPLGYPTAPLREEEPAPVAAAPVAEAAGHRSVVATAEGEEEVTLPDNKKYIFEKAPPAGGAVRMRTHDGKYVPDGALPATL